MNQFNFSWRPVAIAVAAATLSMSALAGEDDFPLSLTLSDNISRDSNFAKSDTNKYGETTNATSALISLQKLYGRQSYQGGLNLTHTSYAKRSDLNYNSKDANGTFTSEFLRDWVLSVNGSHTDALNPIQDNNQQDRVVKNIRKYSDGNVSLQYGNGGKWFIVGTVDRNKLDYSQASYQYQNAEQRTGGLRLGYNSTDTLNYSLGFRRAVTDTPNNTSYQQTTDKDIDFSVNYQATGLSTLKATITRQTKEYVPADYSGNKSWVGSAYWTYTPHGLLSYDLNATRMSGSDRMSASSLPNTTNLFGTTFTETDTQRINNDTLTTVLSGAAHLKATAKVTVNATYSLTQFKLNQQSVTDFSTVVNGGSVTTGNIDSSSTSTSSYQHTTTLSFDYELMRSVALGCSVQKYSQSADLYRVAYHGDSYGCYGKFTLNPL